MRIAFLGTGIMGAPMALNLIRAGFELTVYNRSREKTLILAEAGAAVATTPAAAVRDADVVILMLTGPEAIDAVLEGENGLLAGGVAGKTLVNMSTVPPAYSRRLAARLANAEAAFVDAPVSGSKKPAEEGKLVVLAGGGAADVARVEPILLRMGGRVVHCGPAGAGSGMKMAVNLLLGTMMEGLAEAINFGEREGLDVETMLDAMLSGPLGCGLFELKREMFVRNDYPPQFPYRHMAKDLAFVLETARENGAAVPVGEALAGLYRRDADPALADMDFAAVKRVLAGSAEAREEA